MFIEDLANLLAWLLTLIILQIGAFLAFLFRRRMQHQQYYVAKDAAHERYGPTVTDLGYGRASLQDALPILENATTRPERDAVRDEILRHCRGSSAQVMAELLYEMDYVAEWAGEVFGRRSREIVLASMEGKRVELLPTRRERWLSWFRRARIFAIRRAGALARLAHLPLSYAETFLSAALGDPSVMVRRVAVAQLAAKRSPAAVPLLMAQLERSLRERNAVSLRDVRSALASYEIEDVDYFVAWVNSPEPRHRLFVVDTVGVICRRAAGSRLLGRNDFSPAMYRAILQQAVSDTFADVRARSAHVVRYFDDSAARSTLRTLLRDENEFVRLHAVRASADHRFADLMPDVLRRVRDSKWRVREAAVRALSAYGGAGLNALYDYFLENTDGYSCEQMADEMQRAGYITDLLAAIAGQANDSGRAVKICEKLAVLGKSSYLVEALASVTSAHVRFALMNALSVAPTREYLAVLEALANSADSTAGYALNLLRRFQAQTVTAGA